MEERLKSVYPPTSQDLPKKRKLEITDEADTPVLHSQPSGIQNEKGSKFFIAVHLGAGNHSLKHKPAYKELCKLSCETGLSLLRCGKSADEAVVAATMILESSSIVNAGKGSNLTIKKTVECDAGFMSGNGDFGGAGAVSGIPNPILIAKKIADFQSGDNKLNCGLVPPNFLVGPGAKEWAESQSIPTCRDEELISKRAAKVYHKWMSRIELKADDCPIAESMDTHENEVNDTIGVVAFDCMGHVAATVSSGGNLLKFPGRIGHSPIFGCGCWASDTDQGSPPSVAISTTGVGEMLSKLQWASECCRAVRDDRYMTPGEAITRTLEDKFLGSALLKNHTEPKIAGVIALLWDQAAGQGEFIFGHTSNSFVVGYGGSDFKRIMTEFSKIGTSGQKVKVDALRL